MRPVANDQMLNLLESTQFSERAPARKVQYDTDGSEKSEHIIPITSLRFKQVQRKLGSWTTRKKQEKKNCQKE